MLVVQWLNEEKLIEKIVQVFSNKPKPVTVKQTPEGVCCSQFYFKRPEILTTGNLIQFLRPRLRKTQGLYQHYCFYEKIPISDIISRTSILSDNFMSDNQ